MPPDINSLTCNPKPTWPSASARVLQNPAACLAWIAHFFSLLHQTVCRNATNTTKHQVDNRGKLMSALSNCPVQFKEAGVNKYCGRNPVWPINSSTCTTNTNLNCSTVCFTYMSEQRLLPESAHQSFGVHLAKPQDVQRTAVWKIKN